VGKLSIAADGSVVVAARQSKLLLFLLVGRPRVTGKGRLGSGCDVQLHPKHQGWLGLGQRWQQNLCSVIIIVRRSSALSASSAAEKQVWGNVVGKRYIVVIIKKLLALSTVTSVDKQVWGKGVGIVYFVIIVIVIIINRKLLVLSSVDCIIECGSRGSKVLTVDRQKAQVLLEFCQNPGGAVCFSMAVVWCCCIL